MKLDISLQISFILLNAQTKDNLNSFEEYVKENYSNIEEAID